MLFTPTEIQKFFNIVDYRLAQVVANVFGKDFLSEYDRYLLNYYRFDWNKIKTISPYWQAYLFGRLSSVLTPFQLSTLNYTDINKYVAENQYKQINQRELAEYNVAAINSYSYLKGLGEKIKKTISASVSEEETKLRVEEQKRKELEVIKKELELGVLQKRSVKNIVSNISNQLQDWNRDWGRIVETEFQNIYELGKAQTMMDQYGSDALVYKDVFPGACRYCQQFYTTGGIGTKPRIFKLSKLIENGSNVGRKSKDWRPTLGPTHPFCRCDLRHIPDGYEWNEEKQTFAFPEKYKRKVERKSKVKVTVGDKHFEV